MFVALRRALNTVSAAPRARFRRWVDTRTPRLPGPVTIDRRRVYILPTRFGLGYAALDLVILLGAMNYSNSLAFCLAFLLAGLGLVAMHQTHANLVNLQLRRRRAMSVHAGDTAAFEIELVNPSRRARHAVTVCWTDGSSETSVDVEPGQYNTLKLRLPASVRGWLAASRFAVRTEFPLGLFRAWSWIELDQRCLIYPRAAGSRPLTYGSGDRASQRAAAQAGQDEFAGLRAYQRGDHLRSIHWKSLPKLGQPMVKQFTQPQDAALWLDWATLAPLPSEARLSQLTRWVLLAEAQRRDYGLRLPGKRIAPALGGQQRHTCLQALALYEVDQ